jgi:hypothetical protein
VQAAQAAIASHQIKCAVDGEGGRYLSMLGKPIAAFFANLQIYWIVHHLFCRNALASSAAVSAVSERALKLAVAEMYLQGVSTRNVSAVMEQLCGREVTSMQVSRAVQALDDGLSVVSFALSGSKGQKYEPGKNLVASFPA